VKLFVNIVSTIFMSEKHAARRRTSHVDARYHIIRKFIIARTFKVIFLKENDNKADIFIKNISRSMTRTKKIASRHKIIWIAEDTQFRRVSAIGNVIHRSI
jgi:hypothetical protein